MCWQDETLPILRTLIGDTDATDYTFSDQRLEQTLLVAARYVSQEIILANTYVISMSDCTITPDPSVEPDEIFLNFMSLKAACIADISNFRTKAAVSGLKARCGPGVMETKEHLQGFTDLLDKGPCKAYDTLKDENNFSTSTSTIKAVLSPFVSNTFDPTYSLSSAPRQGYGYDLRDNR